MAPVSSSADEVYFLDLMEERERRESRREAARALGVHPQHLYNIEKRRSGVSLSLALRIVRRYGPLHLFCPRDGAVFLLKQVTHPRTARCTGDTAGPPAGALESRDD